MYSKAEGLFQNITVKMLQSLGQHQDLCGKNITCDRYKIGLAIG
jgi:hypothetical protein